MEFDINVYLTFFSERATLSNVIDFHACKTLIYRFSQSKATIPPSESESG